MSNKIQVLVVEDEAIIALDIKEQLLQLNYEVCATVDSSDKAISFVKKFCPDIILMDIQIRGDKDGIEVAKELLQSIDVPIIFLTAYADKATRERAKALGPYGYIVKPFDTADLNTSLQIALNKHKLYNELKEANYSLNIFSHAISHELKAPIRHILYNIQFLESSFTDKLHQEESEYFDAIKRASENIQKLINKLLAFSQSRKKKIEKKIFSMANLVNKIIEQTYAGEMAKDISFKVENLPEIKADKILIKQVFINLFDNAIKHKSPLKPLQIIIGKTNSDDITYFVQDNGLGFQLNDPSEIFKLFSQFNTDTKTLGLGVGLALVKQIITKHGGELYVESEKDKGTTIFFTLPK